MKWPGFHPLPMIHFVFTFLFYLFSCCCYFRRRCCPCHFAYGENDDVNTQDSFISYKVLSQHFTISLSSSLIASIIVKFRSLFLSILCFTCSYSFSLPLIAYFPSIVNAFNQCNCVTFHHFYYYFCYFLPHRILFSPFLQFGCHTILVCTQERKKHEVMLLSSVSVFPTWCYTPDISSPIHEKKSQFALYSWVMKQLRFLISPYFHILSLSPWLFSSVSRERTGSYEVKLRKRTKSVQME